MEFVDTLKRLSVQIIGGLIIVALCWTANSVNNQNVAIARLVVEVQTLNERSSSFATKESMDAQSKRVDDLSNRVSQLERERKINPRERD